MGPLGIILSLIIIYLIYWYLIKDYNYWKKRGIPYTTPLPIFGNTFDIILMRKTREKFYQEVCKKFPNERFIGLYNFSAPELVITDPEDIKSVLATDFNHFQDRKSIAKESAHLNTQSLVDLPGKLWKPVRQKITPAFTTGKLRNMVPLMLNVGEDLTQYLNSKVDIECEMEALDLMSKFTLDIVSSIGFGIKANVLLDEDSPFIKISKGFFQPDTLRGIKILLKRYFPSIFLKLKGSTIDQTHKKFLYSTIKKIIEERERSGTIRNDFIDIILEVRKKDKEMQKDNSKIDPETVVVDEKFIFSQSTTFFFAGFATSSSLLSFLLHELALHRDIQDKVYREIKTVLDKHEGQLSYETLFKFEYLSMVVNETQRKYPVGNLHRVCTSDYTFTGSNLKIDKGINICIPLYALHNDPKYFPHPEEFIPERFRPGEQQNSTMFLPFGIGPRNCIGSRLAFLQVIVGLVTFLKNYRVKPCKRTVANIEFDSKSLILTSKHELWLSIVKRN